MSLPRSLLAALLLATAACSTPAPISKGGDSAMTAQKPIGTATMLADGTLQLMLRAEGGPALGDALFSYPKGHPEYANVLKHLGGLNPGESKPVPPWPDVAESPDAASR
jgi:hypothetical protein